MMDNDEKLQKALRDDERQHAAEESLRPYLGNANLDLCDPGTPEHQKFVDVAALEDIGSGKVDPD